MCCRSISYQLPLMLAPDLDVPLLRALHFVHAHIRAAQQLHTLLLANVLRLPMSFFDSNPSGRVVNRFSRDVDIVDSTLVSSLLQFIGSLSSLLGILVVICIATPLFTPALLPITVVYVLIQRFYMPAARELQRLESITRSPIYTGKCDRTSTAAQIVTSQVWQNGTCLLFCHTILQSCIHFFLSTFLSLLLRLGTISIAPSTPAIHHQVLQCLST